MTPRENEGGAGRIRVLLVEDNPGDAKLIRRMLEEARGLACDMEWVETLEAADSRLAEDKIDVILLDLGLPGSSGLETLTRLQKKVERMPALVVLSGLSDEEIALQAVQAGAQDYLVKGQVDAPLLARAVRYALERSQAKEALRRAHDELELRVIERTAELQRTVRALHDEIVERGLAEDMLRRREQEFRTLAENTPDMVIRYDLACRRFYANPAYERETGIPVSEALHMEPGSPWQRDPPVEEYKARLQQVMQTGVPAEIEMRSKNAEGHNVYHALHVVPERNPAGKVVGALAIGRNITAFKETERRLKESQHLLRELAARNEAVREEERKHLTREIHDELGQYLSALRLGMSVMGLQFGEENPALGKKIQDMVKLVDAMIKVVRNVVSSLRPAALDMGIVSALEWLADEFRERTGMHCGLEMSDDIPLDEKRAIQVFRIVQESLTNIGRHADASEAEITLDRNDSHYVLEVRDNGKGFDPAVRKKKSFGLVGIRERALMLGGEVDITSAPGHGTAIRVCFPLDNVLSES
jgi:PAS domain S-box-containing protein